MLYLGFVCLGLIAATLVVVIIHLNNRKKLPQEPDNFIICLPKWTIWIAFANALLFSAVIIIIQGMSVWALLVHPVIKVIINVLYVLFMAFWFFNVLSYLRQRITVQGDSITVMPHIGFSARAYTFSDITFVRVTAWGITLYKGKQKMCFIRDESMGFKLMTDKLDGLEITIIKK